MIINNYFSSVVVAMNKVQINNSLGINYNVTDNGTLSTPSLVEWTTATNHSANADTSAAFEFWK